jgi:hypothetical protein
MSFKQIADIFSRFESQDQNYYIMDEFLSPYYNSQRPCKIRGFREDSGNFIVFNNKRLLKMK